MSLSGGQSSRLTGRAADVEKPRVGCPRAGRTHVYIHTGRYRGGGVRAPLTLMQAQEQRGINRIPPASGPHNMQWKVPDFIPERNTEAAEQQEGFLNALPHCDLLLKRGMWGFTLGFNAVSL